MLTYESPYRYIMYACAETTKGGTKSAALLPSRTSVDGRGERIRTSDPLYPKQVRYQAAPRPEP